MIVKDVIVVIGAGSIGQAIARRVSFGRHVLIADLKRDGADAAAKVLGDAGFETSAAVVDVSSRESVHALAVSAAALGNVIGVIHAAGVSPSQASPQTILQVDLYGTALVLDVFGDVIARGGSAVVIASQSGHRLPALSPAQDRALATTPVDELLALPMLQPDQVTDSLHAYQLSKRGNALRVKAQAVRWGRRGARVNTISPGIIVTPLARDELDGPRGDGYRRMIDISAAGRAGTPDEVGAVGALLMGPDGGFITGSDFLMDGGVTAAYWYGDLAPAHGAAARHAADETTDHPRGLTMKLIRAGSQPSTKGSEDYFTGTVRIDPLNAPPAPARVSCASVTFEPGARSAWHTHPLGQTLIVTAGCGWTQCEGEGIVEIRAGDVIWCPPGHRHWHGATPTTAMTHIAVQEALDGKNVLWMEKVTDAEYLAGPATAASK